jgi:2-octaprenyl-6-methoxyphenol hydroxylase
MAERMSTTGDNGIYDVVVVGAGYVGLATAVSIASARPSLRVVIVDAAPADVWKKDPRASAIAAAACRMLESLGCWTDIAPRPRRSPR